MSAANHNAATVIQAAARGSLQRERDQQLRRQFQTILAEVEGADAVRWVQWGQRLGRPRFAQPEDESCRHARELPDARGPSNAMCCSTGALHEELGRLKRDLLRQRLRQRQDAC